MHRLLYLIVFCAALSACRGTYTAPYGWRQHHDEPPVYDYFYGEEGNPVDRDPMFFENSTPYAD